MPLDRNEVWAQAAEIGQQLAQTPEVRAYKKAKAAMEGNPNIRHMLNQLRDLQELRDRFSNGAASPYAERWQNSIKEILEQLKRYPEVQTYQEKREAVDRLLLNVSNLLSQHAGIKK